jgi:hypothetical protein
MAPRAGGGHFLISRAVVGTARALTSREICTSPLDSTTSRRPGRWQARAFPVEARKTKTGVYVISPAGKLLKMIPIPEDIISNTAFGGPDMKTLYVTSGKTVFKVRTEIAGLPR